MKFSTDMLTTLDDGGDDMFGDFCPVCEKEGVETFVPVSIRFEEGEIVRCGESGHSLVCVFASADSLGVRLVSLGVRRGVGSLEVSKEMLVGLMGFPTGTVLRCLYVENSAIPEKYRLILEHVDLPHTRAGQLIKRINPVFDEDGFVDWGVLPLSDGE